jgi:hypothetical protein
MKSDAYEVFKSHILYDLDRTFCANGIHIFFKGNKINLFSVFTLLKI